MRKLLQKNRNAIEVTFKYFRDNVLHQRCKTLANALKNNLKHITEGVAPTLLLSYQRLPDDGPQHHPTHSSKVHCNMKLSQWGGRYSKEEGGGSGRKR